MRERLEQRGVGLIAAIVLLVVISLSIGFAVPLMNQIEVEANSSNAFVDLQDLKVALAGNPRLMVKEGRTDFGYIGTMGSVPVAVSELAKRGSQPTFTFSTTKAVGAGWVGPYVPNRFREELIDLDRDPFGNLWIYKSTSFTRPIDNQVVAARIQSAGADGIADTLDDMIVDILKGEVFSTVRGTLKKGNNGVAFATVTLNTPIGGAVSQRFDVTDSNGVFEFTDVPFGFRSVSVDPKLTYEEGTAKVNSGDSIKFKVTNYGTNDVSITSIRADYTTSPASWFEEVKVGGTTVFSNSSNRKGSGDTITFSAKIVEGSDKPTQLIPIRVDKEITNTPDLELKGFGKSIDIEYNKFRNAQSGSASTVNPANATFTITFSDGSQNTFVVAP